jgi:long-chain acyl-CoA synthetase
MFRQALNSKLYYLNRDGSVEHKFYDKVVFGKIRALLGGEVRIMITGSAPISAEILNTMKVVFSCPIREGYG